MSDQPEPLSAVLAETRKSLKDDSWIDEITALDEDGNPDDFARRVVLLDDALEAIDRIEAAAEREREAAQSARDARDAMDYAATVARPAFVGVDLANNKPTHTCVEIAPGNAAAMRDALERIVQICHDLEPLFTPHAIQQHAEAALSAPARNCDLYPDCNAAWKAYNAIERRERLPGFDFWLFDKAEGGEK